MKKTAIYVTLGVIALFAVIIFSMNISYGNSNIALNYQSIPAWKRLVGLFSTRQNIENQTIISFDEYMTAHY